MGRVFMSRIAVRHCIYALFIFVFKMLVFFYDCPCVSVCVCEWFLFSFIFIIYEHIKKYLFIFMQQFVRREAATNAGAKKYFNAAPARMQRFFHKFTCRPLCVCIWEWHQVVFLCVWQRRGSGKQVHVWIKMKEFNIARAC